MLTSASKPLPISLLIPDTVLTGSRYDVDVVVDQPLGKSLLAGGLISVTPQQVLEQKSPDIQLEPLGGGGLFKSVQAPFQPGSQVWAALLVHPDGVGHGEQAGAGGRRPQQAQALTSHPGQMSAQS